MCSRKMFFFSLFSLILPVSREEQFCNAKVFFRVPRSPSPTRHSWGRVTPMKWKNWTRNTDRWTIVAKLRPRLLKRQTSLRWKTKRPNCRPPTLSPNLKWAVAFKNCLHADLMPQFNVAGVQWRCDVGRKDIRKGREWRQEVHAGSRCQHITSSKTCPFLWD